MDDAALLAEALRGDQAALQTFWERHRAGSLRAALVLTGDPVLAEEALQELWLGLREGLAGFDPALGSPRAWLLGILRHKASRLASRRRGLSLDLPLPGAGGTLGERIACPEAGPEARLQRREETAAALAALEALPEDQREAVACRWILGLSDAEMALALGVSPQAARQRAHRGLLALRAALDTGRS